MAYIYWLTIVVWIPIIVLWIFNWKYLYKYIKAVFYCVIFSLLFSVPWDYWAIKSRIWLFHPDTNLGIWIGGLPVEEYFFIVFVTILISTIALLFRRRIENNSFNKI